MRLFALRAPKSGDVFDFGALSVPPGSREGGNHTGTNKVLTERLRLGRDWGGGFPGEVRGLVH